MNLRKASVLIVTSLALTALCAVSFAQPPAGQGRRGQGQRGLGQATLARIPAAALEKPLSLTADQKTKIEAIQKKYAEDSRALAPQAGGQPDPAARQKRTELSAQATKDIEAVLKEDQKAKVPDLLKQLGGLSGAGIPLEVVGDLKLTADQTKKIEAVETDSQKAMAELRQGAGAGGDRQAMAQKMREMRQASQQKVMDILTADQKAIVTKYQQEHPRQNRRRPGNPPVS